ncbi:MAG: DNA polymerase III subunit delta' [Lachnospiraceae bacterium]
MNEKGFRGVVGHADAVAALKNALSAGRISHAYLFAGEDGSGKHFLAKTFAAALLCKEGGEQPCMRCLSCRRVLAGTQPDLVELVREKPEIITVREIREQVVGTVGMRPYDSKYKVYIIDDAEKMNPQAQNALLKTIEEPPAYVVILMLANSPEALLPTILSRCARIDVRSVPDAEVRSFLIEEHGVSKKDAKIAAAFAQGNLGRAKEIALGETFAERCEQVLDLARRARELPLARLSSASETLLKDGAGVREIQDILRLWYRDILIYKATGDLSKTVFRRTPEEAAKIRTEAALLSYEGLGEIFDAIEKTGDAVRANVSPALSLELLLAAIADCE